MYMYVYVIMILHYNVDVVYAKTHVHFIENPYGPTMQINLPLLYTHVQYLHVHGQWRPSLIVLFHKSPSYFIQRVDKDMH